ncbi:MAG: beta-hydroxyacyl-ACP dehydratase [Verrucomicrobia bacterium]|nr:beta-hydroxyacyl-ACP dehydratase [Verrucomicrobiota bacterium]
MDPIALGLPHREPFVFIEEVEHHEPGMAATATKVFSGEEPFFRGHFPGDPLVPGVLLTEAMAQTAGVALGDADHVLLLAAIQSMKFFRPVRPGERVVFSATKTGDLRGLFLCDVRASVAGEPVAEGRVVLARGPRRKPAQRSSGPACNG